MVDEQGVVVEGVQVWVGDADKEVCGVKIVVCSEVFNFLLRGFYCRI